MGEIFGRIFAGDFRDRFSPLLRRSNRRVGDPDTSPVPVSRGVLNPSRKKRNKKRAKKKPALFSAGFDVASFSWGLSSGVFSVTVAVRLRRSVSKWCLFQESHPDAARCAAVRLHPDPGAPGFPHLGYRAVLPAVPYVPVGWGGRILCEFFRAPITGEIQISKTEGRRAFPPGGPRFCWRSRPPLLPTPPEFPAAPLRRRLPPALLP